ncbi:unnamed protein product [Leptidea sinapis]|uniref:Uncharacterized protein n=1 Tax=Leptidea sinapis TaxID=189913 RepID=A0A5E4PUN3_9NEOP|nr:unnamed protein product [Leptidea sinapis]
MDSVYASKSFLFKPYEYVRKGKNQDNADLELLPHRRHVGQETPLTCSCMTSLYSVSLSSSRSHRPHTTSLLSACSLLNNSNSLTMALILLSLSSIVCLISSSCSPISVSLFTFCSNWFSRLAMISRRKATFSSQAFSSSSLEAFLVSSSLIS